MSQKIIIYQVFTRLFGNKTVSLQVNGNIQENGCGKMADFTAKALNEIKNLGATAVLEVKGGIQAIFGAMADPLKQKINEILGNE